jgi:hypothetical protein
MARGVVTLKDMEVGRQLSKEIEDRKDWIAARSGQREVPRKQLVETLHNLLAEIDGPGAKA